MADSYHISAHAAEIHLRRMTQPPTPPQPAPSPRGPSSGEKINVLLIGGGGREHAIAWKLAQSPRLGTLYATDMQNPGIAALAQPVDVPVDFKRPFRLQRFCETSKIGLVVIGPEEPLADGAADVLAAPGRAIFGPTAAGARLEADKAWCRQLVRGASVPIAEGRSFSDAQQARAYIQTREEPPVVKAAGLAKGKGVVVPETIDEALDAVTRIMEKREFGDAGSTIVVVERLHGREVSLLALTDGRTIYVLEPCQDHKRIGEGDTGPNTGGMGVCCPGGIDEESLAIAQRDILVPTLDAMRREGIDFRGVLYAGLMLTPAGPKLLEFNCRFGDPECQTLMLRLDADLIDVMLATATRTLDRIDIGWSPAASCCVVLASPGYPSKPKLGAVISGIEAAAAVPGAVIFHAGTKRDPATGNIVTAGGRVLSVCAAADTMEEARRICYRAADLITFEGKQVRRDIGGPPLPPVVSAAGASAPVSRAAARV
jgi:phosphoribosylamine--glycine ligase